MTAYEFDALHRALAALKLAREAAIHGDNAQAIIRLCEAEAIVDVRLQLANVEAA